jgi:hypothetical protein
MLKRDNKRCILVCDDSSRTVTELAEVIVVGKWLIRLVGDRRRV